MQMWQAIHGRACSQADACKPAGDDKVHIAFANSTVLLWLLLATEDWQHCLPHTLCILGHWVTGHKHNICMSAPRLHLNLIFPQCQRVRAPDLRKDTIPLQNHWRHSKALAGSDFANRSLRVSHFLLWGVLGGQCLGEIGLNSCSLGWQSWGCHLLTVKLVAWRRAHKSLAALHERVLRGSSPKSSSEKCSLRGSWKYLHTREGSLRVLPGVCQRHS